MRAIRNGRADHVPRPVAAPTLTCGQYSADGLAAGIDGWLAADQQGELDGVHSDEATDRGALRRVRTGARISGWGPRAGSPSRFAPTMIEPSREAVGRLRI